MLGRNEESAWQRASASLDATAKIYGYRVDSVHTETFKFLGGLNRNKKEMNSKEEIDDESQLDGDNTKKKEKIRRGVNTLETISNLSEYYQIFIDNLNGMEDIKIDPIFSCEGLEIFEHFLNFRKELEKNIYRILSYMKLNIPFSYEELNEENYTQKLIEYICNKENEDIRKSFNECIKRQIGQKDNQYE